MRKDSKLKRNQITDRKIGQCDSVEEFRVNGVQGKTDSWGSIRTRCSTRGSAKEAENAKETSLCTRPPTLPAPASVFLHYNGAIET